MRFTLVFLLLFSASSSFGQTVRPKSPLPNIQTVVTNVIGNNMVLDSVFKIPENHAYLYAVALAFDSLGKMEQVYFSKHMRKRLIGIIRPDDLLKNKIKYKWNNLGRQKEMYSNKVVMFPILLQYYSSKSIVNLDEFLFDYTNLWPELNPKDLRKQKILLEPFPNYIHTSVN